MNAHDHDRIEIRDLAAECVIGVYEAERAAPQTVRLDLTLWLDLAPAGVSDALGDTVDYFTVASRALALLQASRRQTLEALATDVARLCAAFARVQRVAVTLAKPAALASLGGQVAVHIERDAADFAPRP